MPLPVAVSTICAVSAYSSKISMPRFLLSLSSFFWIMVNIMLMTRFERNLSCLIRVSSNTINFFPEKSIFISLQTFSYRCPGMNSPQFSLKDSRVKYVPGICFLSRISL